MAEILSFSKARKAKARTGKEAQAAGNRVKFGRTKAEKQLEQAKATLADKKIDGHKIED